MRIVIDMQGAQTASRLRGIGRYTMGLAKALVKNRKDNEVILALSAFEPETVATIRHEFYGLLPPDQIQVWYAPQHTEWIIPENKQTIAAAECIYQQFILSLNPDVLLVSSLFEGLCDNYAFAAERLYQANIAVCAIDYDLIPYLNQKEYLPTNVHREWYMNKFRYLLKADRIFSISEFSRKELLKNTHLAAEKVINIDSDADSFFSPVDVTKTDRQWLQEIGIKNDFVLYTGGADLRKNIDSLIKAYGSLSPQVRAKHQLLIVCGAQKERAAQLQKVAQNAGLSKNEAVILGYISSEQLRLLYRTCKLFVFPSLYEGFGLTVLEAMRCGAAVVASNRSSIPEVVGREDALFDPTDVRSITEKLARALTDKTFLASLRAHSKTQSHLFSWDLSAKRCLEEFKKIVETEKQQKLPIANYEQQIKAVCAQIGKIPLKPDYDYLTLADDLSLTFQPTGLRQLFVDVSELARRDSGTGIQRVTRAILKELLDSPPCGYQVCPVYATPESSGYFYANQFIQRFTGQKANPDVKDPIIDYKRGDFFLGLDLQSSIVPLQKKYLEKLQMHGIPIYFVVYDLLPVLHPEFFRDVIQGVHQTWLETISKFDGACCISQAVAGDMKIWLRKYQPAQVNNYQVSWFHLGSDIKNSHPSAGMPQDAAEVLAHLKGHATFLMVSTVEPRKGYAQALAAFERLWKEGTDVNLVIVGREGWNVADLIEKIRSHPELGQHLFWLQGISDEYLEKVYDASTVVLMASEGEGFGLAVVEGAQHKKPLILRDLPVFREIAGNHAFYFHGLEPENLADVLEKWLKLYAEGEQPISDGIECLTWKESTQMLLNCLFK